jgi:heat shock protein HtpX
MSVDRTVRDRGLTVRMILVMIYLAVVLGLALVTMIVLLRGLGVIIAAFVVLVLTIAWFASGPVSLRAIGARLVTPESEPELHGALDRLCALSGIPKPKLAVMKAWDPNAFAYGRSPKHAVIVLTRPLVELLEPDELEAVLAHELAHLAHGDLLVLSVATSPGLVRSALGDMMKDSGRGWPVIFVAWAFTGLVNLLSFLPARLLSRYRELCADVAAAQLTQRPDHLAAALQKISSGATPIPSHDLRSTTVIDTFGIVAADGRSTGGLTSTHPRLDRRMAQLARLGAELGRPTS